MTTTIHSCDTADIWSKWLSRLPVEFAQIYLKNRQIHEMVKMWFSKETYEQSLWHYGIKNERLLSLDEIETNITYTDLLVFFSRFLQKTCYLEIGVSVGKNFFLLSKHLENSTLYGLDIEEINPIIESFYTNRGIIWESSEYFSFRTYEGSKVKKKFSLKEYYESKNRNKIYYLCGDKFQDALWQQLKGEKFTMVFSDACHNPKSIVTEMEYMLKYDLINHNEFIMLWDDISQEMIYPLLGIFDELNSIFKDKKSFTALLKIHGTYGGDNQGFHHVGVFISDNTLIPNRTNAQKNATVGTNKQDR